MIRVVVIGAVRFTATCLEALIRDAACNRDYQVVGLVTAPIDNARNSDAADLAIHSDDLGCPLLRTTSTRDGATVAAITAWRPDLILVLGWSQLLDERLLTLPRLGCIGSHPAPLPRGRGRHPLVWSILLGWPGCLSLFQLETGADTGAIWLQRPFAIGADDHASEAYATMSATGAGMVVELLRGLRAGTLRATPQDHALATTLRKRSAVDGILRFVQPAAVCHALVRAIARPYPGAVIQTPAGDLICWRVASQSTGRVTTAAAGTVVASDGQRLEIMCADRTLVVTDTTGPRPAVGFRCTWPTDPCPPAETRP